MTVQGDLDTANTNLDTANTNLDTANSNLDTANSNLMTVRGELDTANSNLDTANSNLMTAEGERDTANTNLDTANTNLDTANTNLDTANSNLDTANTNLDTANSNLMTVRGELDTANSNLMTAEGERDAANIKVGMAEGERDAANIALGIAVAALNDEMLEFAQILDVITNVDLDLATDYDTIEAGAYVIQPGYPMDVDDVKFECPAGVLPCVVLVIKTTDDETVVTTTVVSLGGAASGGNTVGIMDLRAANALTVASAGLDAPVTGHMVVVTRDTEGETEIDLTTPPVSEEVYVPEAETDQVIRGWPGQTLERGGNDVLGTPQEATVYTNIKAATPAMLMFTGNDVPAPATSRFVLDPKQDEDEDLTDSFTGAYGSVPGTFTCDDDTEVRCTGVATMVDEVGDARYLSVALTSGWTFVSTDYAEDAAVQDDDYLYFGYWLQSPQDPGVDTPVYLFATYSGGANPYNVASTLVNNEDDEGLTANYVGGAAGRYATTKVEIANQLVDPDSPRKHGRFTATARLTANFGEHESIDVDVQNQISGEITDFEDSTMDPMDLGFGVVKLEAIAITEGGDPFTGGDTSTTFENTAINTRATGAGTWSGQFFGPNADDTEDDMDNDNSLLPTGVAGEFNVSSANNSTYVVGAFAAQQE